MRSPASIHISCDLGTGSFETEPPDLSEMVQRWIEVTARGLPWLMAEDGGDIVEYAYAAPYRSRPVYRHTVENSVYVRVDLLGTG
jgi:L-amino acid N-acyltransferase YncA